MAFGEMGIAGTLKDGRRVDQDGKVVNEFGGNQGRSGAEAKGVHGEDQEARNRGVGNNSRRDGDRSADLGISRDNVSSTDATESRKAIDTVRDVVGEVGIQVFQEIYREMEEVKQVARAKGELAEKYYQRAQKYYLRAHWR